MIGQGKVSTCFASVEIIQSFESYPDELEEKKLPRGEYLVFSTWISSDLGGTKKLKSKELYMGAAEYVLNHDYKINPDFCLEREYRKDGKYVDKIELYVPIKVAENNG